METGLQNEIWARKLIDGLIAQGIDYFCCGPGSRSTTLSLAIANHPKAKWTVHFDERGLGFHAVGYGKAAKKPAVVMVTSGTAVSNLMPAIIEACNDMTPMIILTADRPPELRDCGANQTCDQVKMFSNFVRLQIDLPCPDDHLSDRYLASTLSHAVAMASYPPAGPVHINCMFREPLFGKTPDPVSLQPCVQFAAPQFIPSVETIDHWAEKLSKKRRGVIVVGSSSSDLNEAVFLLAKHLQWPVFADILSSLRTGTNDPSLITHFDPILKLKNSLEIDAVIQFGNRFVSKTLAQWLNKQTLEFYLHVSEHPLRQDPLHLVTDRIIASPNYFVRELIDTLTIEDNSWLKEWSDWDAQCKEKLAELFSANNALTEPGLIWEIASFLSPTWNLFLANSMPIRDADHFFLPVSSIAQIFGNRGVSGIDGNIATACGLSVGNNKPTLAVIGDLTFLHDLNSLAMLAKSPHPIVLCVVNNGGGGIFSFLPVSKREEAFESFIAAAHTTRFDAAAKLFDIPYFHPETPGEFGELLFDQEKNPHSCIIEIATDRAENFHVHQQLITTLGTCLNSANSPQETPITLH